MFENVIGQNDALDDIKRDIAAGTLPASLLFHGPEYTGKLTVALEMARVLSCLKDSAPWNCDCTSCGNHRFLTHSEMLLLGNRYFKQDIAACGDTLLRSGSEAGKYLYIRAIRKLVRRYDPVLWEGEESKLSGISEAAQETEELLEEFYPGRDLPAPEKMKKTMNKITGLTDKLADAVPDTIPVNNVRNAVAWSHITTPGKVKVIIIENADRMSDASRNSLLKALEEPPAGVYYLLLTSRKGALIPTVLSRLRPYLFKVRSREDREQVFRRIFRLNENLGWESLNDFFRDRRLSGESKESEVLLQNAADLFLKGVAEKDIPEMRYILGEVENAVKSYPFKEGFKYFLEVLTNLLAVRLKEELDDPHTVRRHHIWDRYIHEVLLWRETFNMNPALCLENLFLNMRRSR
ncbi:MAG: hypothetical protein ACLFST_01195 [Spirochaetia bacterium]